MKTYYVDVTMTVQQGFNTGVQRVVRAIVSHGQALARLRGVALIPVIAWDGRFHAIRSDRQDVLFQQRGAAGGRVYAPSPRWRRLARQAVKLFPRRVYTSLLDREAERITRRAGAELCDLAPVDFGMDDRLLLIDSLAARSPAVHAARTAAAAGVRTVLLVYDLIPVTHPHYVSDDARRNFEESLWAVLPGSAGVIAISRFVRTEMLELLQSRGLEKPVESFYLGHDFGDTGAGADGGWETADATGSRVPLFLMIGSIDPRKGHAYVLDAFEQLWARGIEAELFIIGKMLGDTGALAARCAEHPELGRRLRIGHDVSDAELRAAMDRAHGAVIASTVEGFGLPLVECLSAGLPVLASDIPVFREIAGDHALFFDLAAPDSLAGQVEWLIANPDRGRASAARFAWIDWAESARQFLDGVDRVTD